MFLKRGVSWSEVLTILPWMFCAYVLLAVAGGRNAHVLLGGFLFVNVPVLDSHLHEKYGAAFDEYASRTWKLIPFVY